MIGRWRSSPGVPDVDDGTPAPGPRVGQREQEAPG